MKSLVPHEHRVLLLSLLSNGATLGEAVSAFRAYFAERGEILTYLHDQGVHFPQPRSPQEISETRKHYLQELSLDV